MNAAEVERIEACAWAELQGSLSPPLQSSLGISVRHIAGAVALLAAKSETLPVNRVIGLGVREPLTDDIVARVIEMYEATGARRFGVQLSPEAVPSHAGALLSRRGFRIVSHTTKLWRSLPASVPRLPTTSLRIVEISSGDASVYESTVGPPLGVPPELRPCISSTIGKPGWRYYLALDDNRPVAGGAFYHRGEYAWFGLSATHTDFRRRGAQSALLAKRLVDAAAVGCRWATADTLAESSRPDNPSLRNARRLGFETLYDRPNYVGPTPTETT